MSTPAPKPAQARPRKLRLACDGCHRSKTRCSGGNPCSRCHEYLSPCTYSYSSRCGKPKGSRSRKTLEREQRVAAAAETARLAGNPVPASQGPTAEAAAADAAAVDPPPPPLPSPRPDDFSSLCLFDEEEELNPIFFAERNGTPSCSDTGATAFSTDWIPPLPSIPDSDLSFPPPLETTCLSSSGPDPNDPLLWGMTPKPECQPASKEPLDPPSKPLRPCKCLQTLSSLTSRDIRRHDATFVFVRNFARAFSRFYQCLYCPKDAGSISLAVTALQLATTALEKTTNTGADAAVSSVDFEEDLFASTFLPCTPGSELLLPSSSRSGATNPSFQLGNYQIAPLPGEHDAEEHSQIVNVLIRSGVRRLLAVCWQIWDLLRAPVSFDGRGHAVDCHDRSSSSSSSSSSSPFPFAPDISQLFDLSCSAETAQVRSTLVQIPARLCNLLT
ncbi:Zn(II)2Cys6 domain-containing transcription factor gliZ [Aspergillus thermomutatus]|uniref:Zn(2)-C6 fungal-type domain-containing protein n=1 Tax=Aspergillus thermomutatus TaxID=41047 RepID=A0A397G209_ASPTH|nr:uncharacterized protein CDV56_100588 [Aspergillus thermomutatus]RHZ44667.1 hypothetical protein CDV56_100588 [Aspergillus thermomutatus]